MRLIHKKRVPFLQIVIFGIIPSFLKKAIYKVMGGQIGKKTKIGFGSVIISPSIDIEDNVRISPFCVIITDRLHIESNVSISAFCYFDLIKLRIGANTRIRESVHVGGNKTPNSEFIIGKNCLILQNSIINTSERVTIGNNSAIGGGSKLFTHSSWLSILDGYPVIQGPITIGDNVWLPYDTTVLANYNIGSNTIITPRSIINQDIPPNSIAGGNPIRIGKNYFKRSLKASHINKIYSGIINDLVCTLEYDGFNVSESTDTHRVVKKGSNNIILATDISGTTLLQEKSTILLLNNLQIENISSKIKASVVYIDNKIPKVINKTNKTDLLLAFLSRYGIR